MMIMRFFFFFFFSHFLYKGICCGYSVELHRQVDAIQMRTHNICLYKGICCGYSVELHRQVDAIQMRTHNICLYKKVNKMYTSCNLKTTEFHECALIGVCAVILSNTVYTTSYNYYWEPKQKPS